MNINIPDTIKNPIILEGFPGFGLVGAIATEYLVNHLEVKPLEKLWFEELTATVALHNGKVIYPLTLYYNEKYNILILHAITASTNLEWRIADIVIQIAEKTNAKEIISIEGIGSSDEPRDESGVFHYSNDIAADKKLESIGSKQLSEGIVIGVTSALLMKSSRKITALFAETYSDLPDSKAAAKIIETLDKYLGLNVDYHPLLDVAEKFENQIKDVMEKSQNASKMRDKKSMSYVG